MSEEHRSVTVISADISKDGLIVYFSDGISTLFQNHFLYEVRESNGNIPLTDLDDEEPPKQRPK